MFSPPRSARKSRRSSSTPNSLPKLSQKSLFLALYARYIAGEKRKDEEAEMVLGPNDGGQTANRELSNLTNLLDTYFTSQNGPYLESYSEGWLEYLYGIILSKAGNERAAREWLVHAVRRNPCHWGAWEELAALLPSGNDALDRQIMESIPPSVMKFSFIVHSCLDLSVSSPDRQLAVEILNALLLEFPTNAFLLTAQALLCYHGKDYEPAANIFQALLIAHPFRLNALDHYSNILYVLQDRPKLSFLAHVATSTDKFRPETCCIVGNYYSLCSQHEKAVMYFRRALILDKNYTKAWIMMGHEYVEMKNTHAAIESYRRAVELNRKEYTGWYGLGQAYELLDMAFYALFYFQRAATLRPYDDKMWRAVGECYFKMGRLEQSIQAYKRALIASIDYETTTTPPSSFSTSISSAQGSARHDASCTAGTGSKTTTGRKLLDPEVLHKIGTLHDQLGDPAEAARYMELTLAQETGSAVQKARQSKTIARRKLRAREKKAMNYAPHGSDDVKEGHDDVDNNNMPEDEDDEGRNPDNNNDDDDDDDDDKVTGHHSITQADDGFGCGPTATTSKARLWLARRAVALAALDRAEILVAELCEDGYEVEDAKALGREVAARKEATAAAVRMR